jgi:hypothetical protein
LRRLDGDRAGLGHDRPDHPDRRRNPADQHRASAGDGQRGIGRQRDTPTDAAATFTARINDTTPATTNATAAYKHVDTFNLVNGYQWIWPERARPTAKLSEALIFSLDSAPAGGRAMSGSMKVRELF